MSSMGMDKSGETNLTVVGAWEKVQGMVPRSGFPATVITNNALVIDVNGSGNLTWRGTMRGNLGTQQFRVVKNGTTVLGTVTNTGVVGNLSGVAFLAGDTIELQGFASSSGFRSVLPAPDTYLQYTQTTSEYPIATVRSWQWTTSTSAVLTRQIGAARPWQWAISAGIGLDSPIAAERPWQWSTEADLYLGQFYDIEADRPWRWNIDADMLQLFKAEPPTSSFQDIAVSVHTVDGRAIGDLTCQVMTSIEWGREATEVSVATITASTQGDPDLMEDLRPWAHWVTIWHNDRPRWTGPIQSVTIGRASTTITARDPSTFMWRTRVPVTRTWEDNDPTAIAASVIETMNQLHRIDASPIILPGLSDVFTYTATADARMLHQMMDDLVKLGLDWTVVAGRFVLGEFTSEPVAELAECDFLVDIDRLRDGSGTFNDVRVQGQNWAQTAVAPLANMRLQTLVSLDDVFGVSNIQKAARLYASEVAAIRDTLVIPAGASLHPEAPVTLDDLVPGKMLRVSSDGVVNLMRVDQMQVAATPGSYDTRVTLVAEQNRGEIAELSGGGST